MTQSVMGIYSPHMSEPLTAALARAASRFVGESKIGPRKGSVAAVARAMSGRGVEISNNTLSRKLDGAYPLSTDEIGALAAVLGVDPDVIWQDALRILREEQAQPATTLSEHIAAQLGPDAQDGIRIAAAQVAEQTRRGRTNGP